MIRIFIFGLLMVLPVSVQAQDVSLDVLCKSLPEYQQGGAEYKSGITINGKPVTSANLRDIENKFPKVTDIPVTVDLAERFKGVRLPRGVVLEPDVGVVSIEHNGRVKYNGQDISRQAYSACGRKERVRSRARNEQFGPALRD